MGCICRPGQRKPDPAEGYKSKSGGNPQRGGNLGADDGRPYFAELDPLIVDEQAQAVPKTPGEEVPGEAVPEADEAHGGLIAPPGW